MADFDPDQYLAEKLGQGGATAPAQPFDPDVYLREKLGAQSPSFTGSRAGVGLPAPIVTAPGRVESLARGAAQGGTFGFADEIEGALPAGLQALYNVGRRVGINTPLGETDADGKPVGAGDVYREYRDTERAKNQAAIQSHPGMFLLGALGGSLATGKVLPFPGAKAPLAAKIGTGALYSGLNSAGISNADSLGGVARDASGISGAEDAARDVGGGHLGKAFLDALGSGALSGGVLAGVGPTLARGIGSRLREEGLDSARRALYNVSQRLSSRKEIPTDAVETVLQSGAMPFGSNAKTLARNLVDKSELAGTAVGDIINEAGAHGIKVPVAPIYNELGSRAVAAMPNFMNDTVPNIYRDAALAAMDRGGVGDAAMMDVRQAEALKRHAQEIANSAYKQFQPSSIGEANMGVAAVLKRGTEQALDDAAQAAPAGSELSDLGERFRAAKQLYGRLAEARDLSLVGKARGASRTAGGLVGEELAGEALHQVINGNPVEGLKDLATKQAFQFYRNRGPSAAANTLYFGGKALASPNGQRTARQILLGGQRALEAANPPPVRVRVIDPQTGETLGGDY